MSKQLPHGWNESSIGKITSKNSLFCDGDWVESKDQDPAGTNRLIQLADIGDGVFVNKSSRFMNDEQFERLKCTELKHNDILIARMPDPLGRACLYSLGNVRAATVVDVALIRTPNVDHYWLMSVINSSDFRYQIDLNATGTTRTRIGRGVLSSIKLLEPPLPEQQKIATILSTVDKVIESTRAQIDKLKDLKTGMMQELFTKGIGVDGKPHTEFKDSPIGRIPAGWDVVKLSDVIQKFQNGYAFSATGYVDDGVPIISMASIGLDGNFKTLYTKTKYWDASKVHHLERYKVQNGDLLIAMTDVTPTMELIGRCCIARLEREHLLNQRVGLIRIDGSQLDKLFFAYFSNYDLWRDYARGMSGLGAQANLGTTQITDGMIILPPLKEQLQISAILHSIDKVIEEKVRIGLQQKSIKKALMQDLLTGKVRVKIDDKEKEPALA